MTGAYEGRSAATRPRPPLALEDFGNAAGGFALEYEALDDGIAANQGGWDAGKEAENANLVINDPDAMVYIATYNSGAAKISIPILNQAGMAMISREHLPRSDQGRRGHHRRGRAGDLLPERQAQLHARRPRTTSRASSAANWAFNRAGRK